MSQREHGKYYRSRIEEKGKDLIKKKLDKKFKKNEK